MMIVIKNYDDRDDNYENKSKILFSGCSFPTWNPKLTLVSVDCDDVDDYIYYIAYHDYYLDYHDDKKPLLW